MAENGFRVCGYTIYGERVEIFIEPVRPARGFGRWIYCKYCDKHVKPMLSGRWQLICSECGYGLSPDFGTEKELREWLACR